MAGERAAVAPAEHDMGVQRRLALRREGDVAHERGDFHLLAHGNFLVLFPVPIKIFRLDVAQRADGGELGGGNPFAPGELAEGTKHFLPVFSTIAKVRWPLCSCRSLLSMGVLRLPT